MSQDSNLIATDIEEYLRVHENKDLMRFITCGSVDDGKSTLIGRLLFDTMKIKILCVLSLVVAWMMVNLL